MAGELIRNLYEPKREVQVWKRQCPTCYIPLNPDEESKKKKKSSKIKCLTCDRDVLDEKSSMVVYPVKENVNFVWEPSLRFKGQVYFEISGSAGSIKICMKSLIYFKNELIQLMKRALWYVNHSDDHQITMCHKSKGIPFRLMFSMKSDDDGIHVTFFEEGERRDTLFAENIVTDHSRKVVLDEEELCRLILNIQLDYPDVVKREVYIP